MKELEDANQQAFPVDLSFTDERLDKYLTAIYKNQSRSFFQKLIKEQQVLVNGIPQKANFRLNVDDTVSVTIPKAQEIAILPEPIALDILYEDSDLLIVNKPKGMVVHPSAGHYTGTLVNAVMYHCKDSLSGINGQIRPGIVHRIDMDTTGALIICKNDNAHLNIASQLREHSTIRRYRGIVNGYVAKSTGKVEGPIGRHPIDRKKMSINEKHGKSAITHYQVLERFSKHTYMEFQLETGRTHQIRVHMASIGHPLLGDALYGNGAKIPRAFDLQTSGPGILVSHLQGQTLHAMVIGFIHPTSNAYIEITAPLPTYFLELLTKL
ncbi:RluA family pseudouridine synthase [Lachnospiraceae bacterium ZAX-1]